MTTACTAVASSKPPTATVYSNGLDHHHEDDYHIEGDEDEDEEEEEEEHGGESQLFSPPPRSWFLQDEQQQQHHQRQQHHHHHHHAASTSAANVNQLSNSNTSSRNDSHATASAAASASHALPLAAPTTPTPTLSFVNSTTASISSSSSPPHTPSPQYHFHQQLQQQQQQQQLYPRIAAPQQAPSWQEVSCRVLPAAAKELISTCLRRMVDTAHRGYVQTKWTRKYSDLGNNAVGYYNHPHYYTIHNNNEDDNNINNHHRINHAMQQVLSSLELPPFSSLPWIDRQLVAEWRTFDFSTNAVPPTTNHNAVGPPPPPQPQQQQRSSPVKSTGNPIYSSSSSTRKVHQEDDDDIDDDEMDMDDEEDLHSFDKARALVPKPLPRPTWQCAEYCFVCSKPFGPTRLRHHCRLCGNSYCQVHSSARHALPHLGYDPDVPERVCDGCKGHLLHLNHVERVAWRLARCRDLEQGQLTPYFETGVDTLEQAAWRVAKATISMVKSFPLMTCVLGTSATVAVETLDVLRQYGLSGIYGILLRREFLAAADLLRRALGINRTSWPLSVHELTAAIFYALAQHRAMRGLHPDQEHLLHSYRSSSAGSSSMKSTSEETDPTTRGDSDDDIDMLHHSPPRYHPNGTRCISSSSAPDHVADAPPCSFTPVCDPVSDALLGSLLWYAPLALKFIYAAREVDIQLLAAQQGWRLLYAHLEPEQLSHYDGDGTPTAAAAATAPPPPTDDDDAGGAFWEAKLVSDRPATAMLVHQQAKVACLVIRGTTTIQDVVTDIRQTPIPFPTEAPSPTIQVNKHNNNNSTTTTSGKESSFDEDDDEEDWTSIFRGQGLAVCGMANAALTLFRDHVDVLVFWAQKGYRIRITGHSLGGGVGALLGVLLLRHFEELQLVPPSSSSTTNNSNNKNELGGDQDLLRVYAYGTPSCVDGVLSDKVKPFVTSVVLHDDVVPRLTPTSIRGLLKHLLFIRETWVKAHMPDDIFAITERAKSAWAPRWRGSFTLRGSTPSSIQRYCRKQLRKGTRKFFSVKGKLAVAMTQSGRHRQHHHHHHASVHIPNDDLETISETSSGVQMKQGRSSSSSIVEERRSTTTSSSIDEDSLVVPAESGQEESSSMEPAPRLLLDYMGGMDNRTKGIVIDGDEFFDTERSLLLEEDEESSEVEEESEWRNKLDQQQPMSLPPVHEIVINDDNWHASGKSDAQVNGHADTKVNKNEPDGAEHSEDNDDDNTNEDGSPAVVLEELPLPRMYLPGQVVHIYAHRGVFRAAVVPRNFRDLRRISMAGNMLSDHTSQAYYNALLEVQTVRDAPEAPPRWAAFDEDDTCACCASLFTWASTSDSKAQEARDKHNCRSCGSLVCDPCSQNRIPLPSIGITVPSRVCDRCYNDTKSPMLTQSGLFATARTTHFDLWKKPVGFHPWSRKFFQPEDNPKPERQRERRSAVVDELASRIPSAATAAVSVSSGTTSWGS